MDVFGEGTSQAGRGGGIILKLNKFVNLKDATILKKCFRENAVYTYYDNILLTTEQVHSFKRNLKVIQLSF